MSSDRVRVRDIFLKHEYGYTVEALQDKKQITDVLLDATESRAVSQLVYGYTFTRVPQCHMPHQRYAETDDLCPQSTPS